MIKQIPNGVYPTMITPYTKDNKIDYNAVLELLQWYDARGVTGVFAICLSSEIFFLDFNERLELLKFIMKNKPARLTVVASGHTADTLDRQVYEANAFIETGVDAYVFISNRLAKQDESDDILLKNMEYAVSRIPDIALGIYECPFPYNRLLTPRVLTELAGTDRFRFIKDTCCDLRQIEEKAAAVRGTGLKIFNANAATLLGSLRLGCAGYSGVMANFHPEIYADLCACYETDPARAQILQDFIGFFSVVECQCYPTNAKYYLQLEGLHINLDSRSRSKADFKSSRMLEIDQMHDLTRLFKTTVL